MASGERKNQKQRTRDALVRAAVQLLQSGQTPTVSEVARAALVSPATAYRYFPSAQTLWVSVLQAIGEPSEDDVFAGLERADVETRVVAMIEQVAGRMLENETFWRTAHAVQFERGPEAPHIPVRTGARMRWIDAALEPARRELGARNHKRVSTALALILGADAMITLRDVCGLTAHETKEISVWAARALVRAARAERGEKAKPTKPGPAVAKRARKRRS
ncbi:MAG TPA: TetR/AcrR family transcriptional regulator [Polyangiales bacterium]|nr:TetR/AcrR family transcriptional regulator [Polyangiales bacterium]